MFGDLWRSAANADFVTATSKKTADTLIELLVEFGLHLRPRQQNAHGFDTNSGNLRASIGLLGQKKCTVAKALVNV